MLFRLVLFKKATNIRQENHEKPHPPWFPWFPPWFPHPPKWLLKVLAQRPRKRLKVPSSNANMGMSKGKTDVMIVIILL